MSNESGETDLLKKQSNESAVNVSSAKIPFICLKTMKYDRFYSFGIRSMHNWYVKDASVIVNYWRDWLNSSEWCAQGTVVNKLCEWSQIPLSFSNWSLKDILISSKCSEISTFSQEILYYLMWLRARNYWTDLRSVCGIRKPFTLPYSDCHALHGNCIQSGSFDVI